MRVLLIKPKWNYPADRSDSTYNRIWPPLSLLNCAALLEEAGDHATVIDCNPRHLAEADLIQHASQHDLIIVTSSGLDRWQCPNLDLGPFLATVRSLQKAKKPVLVCGTHGTVRPEEILKLTNADAVIRGEPESIIIDLANDPCNRSLDGLTYASGSGITHTPDRHPFDLSRLPVPAYQQIDLKHYFYEVLGDRFALLETSRGCPWDCIFCVKNMYGPGTRHKSSQQVCHEIDVLLSRDGARNIYFIDLEFTIHRDLVLAVCDHLSAIGTKVNWCCQTRVDAIDDELLERMKLAGCRIIHFGVETGSARIASLTRKNISREQVRTGLAMTHRHGIQSVCFFLFGLPTETLDDMQDTIRLARELNPTYASFHIALPYPGTAFHKSVEEQLDDSLFPVAYTGVVPLTDLERIVKRAFITFYFRPRYLLARVHEMTAGTLWSHAKFFVQYLRKRLRG